LKTSTISAQKTDTTKVENRSPNEKDAPDPDVLFDTRHLEEQQIGDAESVGDGNETHPGQLGHQRRKQRIDEDHTDERACKQPLKIFNPARNSHLVADGP
jgi:hypothetical protein